MPVRPCLQPRCPSYAEPGKSYCAAHQRQEYRRRRTEGASVGTTPEWAKARTQALDRDGHRCVKCGSTTRLQVHHIDGGGIRAGQHDVARLVTLCHRHHVEATKQQRRRARKPKPGSQTHLPPWMRTDN